MEKGIDRFIAVGGGSRSDLWCQIFADVTGKQVYRANTTEAAALGAGILAAYAVGWYPSVQQAAQAMSRLLPNPFQPDPKQYDLYTRIYEEVYRHLFPALQPFLTQIPNIFEITK